jgi:hypothetical protein
MSGTVFSGTYTNGVVLSDPATQNPATVAASGYITNTASAGIALYGEAGFAWTVTNYGTVEHQFTAGAVPTVELASGGDFTNRGVVFSGSPVVGLSLPPAIVISGAPGTIANSCTMGGVYLDDGGSVANAAGAHITGPIVGMLAMGVLPGVQISGAEGIVDNLGTVSGVVLGAGGAVINGSSGATDALIGASRAAYAPYGGAGYGIKITGAGTVTNYGTINAGVGINISGPGTVVNYGTAAFIRGVFGHGPEILPSSIAIAARVR